MASEFQNYTELTPDDFTQRLHRRLSSLLLERGSFERDDGHYLYLPDRTEPQITISDYSNIVHSDSTVRNRALVDRGARQELFSRLLGEGRGILDIEGRDEQEETRGLLVCRPVDVSSSSYIAPSFERFGIDRQSDRAMLFSYAAGRIIVPQEVPLIRQLIAQLPGE